VNPYYDEGGITIYHGDCREILPSIDADPALVLTDPPYGIAYKPLRGIQWAKMWGDEDGARSTCGSL
jgi:DNA modification methylase